MTNERRSRRGPHGAIQSEPSEVRLCVVVVVVVVAPYAGRAGGCDRVS